MHYEDMDDTPDGSDTEVEVPELRFVPADSSRPLLATLQKQEFGVSRWSPFLKSIRAFSVVGLTMNSDECQSRFLGRGCDEALFCGKEVFQ